MQAIDKQIDPLHDVPETAERLRVKPPTIRKWLVLRKIGFHKVGGRTLIPESEIERILAEGFVPAISTR